MKFLNRYNSVSAAIESTGNLSPNVTFVDGALNTDGMVFTDIGNNKEVQFYERPENYINGKERVIPVPLTFTAEQAQSSVKLVRSQTPDSISLQYSTDGQHWNSYSINDVITLTHVGDKVMFSATESNASFSKDASNYYYFVMTGKIAASGTVTSLLDKAMQRTDAPLCCYYYLFGGCGSLTAAPELPAMSLTKRCYCKMFMGCNSLTVAPELPASVLADYCYDSMFSGCTSLLEIPELNAVTVAASAYQNMFEGCTSIVKAVLPATTVSALSYQSIFFNCSNLKNVTMLSENIDMYTFNNWLYGVGSGGTLTKKSSISLSSGASGIPSGWTVVNI